MVCKNIKFVFLRANIIVSGAKLVKSVCIVGAGHPDDNIAVCILAS